MQIKGTAVKTTEQFMREKYPNLFMEWKKQIPNESKPYFKNIIKFSDWYPLSESVIYPTETVAKLLNKSKEKSAHLLGKYSAEVALKGVYKIFIRISSPQFVISRATHVFATYYDDAQINMLENKAGFVRTEIKGFEEKDQLIFHRIAGWMEGTLEATSKKLINTELEIFSDEDKHVRCIIEASWDQ